MLQLPATAVRQLTYCWLTAQVGNIQSQEDHFERLDLVNLQKYLRKYEKFY